MKKITRLKFYEIIENVKRHQKEMDRFNDGLSLMLNNGVYSDYGGALLDNYIDLLMYLFNDDEDLIVWFIYENEFGKNNLRMEINGEQVKIANTVMLFNQLKTRRKRNEKL